MTTTTTMRRRVQPGKKLKEARKEVRKEGEKEKERANLLNPRGAGC